jgi:hypothetical protein
MFREHFVGGGVELVLGISGDLQFVLSLKKGETLLVEYRGGRRLIRGRASPYEFKSVEKLRYDFERDAEDALRQA